MCCANLMHGVGAVEVEMRAVILCWMLDSLSVRIEGFKAPVLVVLSPNVDSEDHRKQCYSSLTGSLSPQILEWFAAQHSIVLECS